MYAIRSYYALAEYEIALALNDETADPDNEADLLLNVGNGHYLLKNYYAAHLYYGQRLSTGIGFFNPVREAIFHVITSYSIHYTKLYE